MYTPRQTGEPCPPCLRPARMWGGLAAAAPVLALLAFGRGAPPAAAAQSTPARGRRQVSSSQVPSPRLHGLTRIDQVRALPAEKAVLGYPVRLRGVVTCYDPDWTSM